MLSGAAPLIKCLSKLLLLCLLVVNLAARESAAQQNPALDRAIQRAETLLEQGKPAKALTEIKPHLRTLKQSPNGILLYGRILIERGKFAQAAEIFNALHKREPQNTQAIQWLAYTQAELKKYEASNRSFVKLMQLQGQSSYAHTNVCINFYNNKKYQKAVNACTTAINIEPNNSDGAYAYRSVASFRLVHKASLGEQEQFLKRSKADCNKAGSFKKVCQPIWQSKQSAEEAITENIIEDENLNKFEKLLFKVFMFIFQHWEIFLVTGLAFITIVSLVLFPLSHRDKRQLSLERPFVYSGRALKLFGIWLKNLLLTIITLGVYRFWGITRIRNYLWARTSLNEIPFEYHGTGKELFKGFLKVFILIILFAFIPDIISVATKNPYVTMVAFAAYMLAYVFVYYLVIYAATRYRLSRTTWQSVRFWLNGKAKTYGWRRFQAFIGKFLTLGLLNPRFDMWCYRYLAETLQYGSIKAHLADYDTAHYRALKRSNMLTLTLAPFTLFISRFWYKAALIRFQMRHTYFGDLHLESQHTGGGLAWLWLSNILLVTFTLGLAVPVVIHRVVKYQTSHIGLVGDSETLVSMQVEASTGAAAEGMDDGFGGDDFGFIG